MNSEELVLLSFPVTEEDRNTFKTAPLDGCISAHAFTRLMQSRPDLDALYCEDFGISHGKLWIKVRQK